MSKSKAKHQPARAATGRSKGTWGGKRTPGDGKKIGRPCEMSGGKSITIYVDEATLNILHRIAAKPSQAIRLLTNQYKETHP